MRENPTSHIRAFLHQADFYCEVEVRGVLVPRVYPAVADREALERRFQVGGQDGVRWRGRMRLLDRRRARQGQNAKTLTDVRDVLPSIALAGDVSLEYRHLTTIGKWGDERDETRRRALTSIC